LAAAQFNWLVMAGPLNQSMLLGDEHTPDDGQLDAWADAAVGLFLAAHGQPPGGCPSAVSSAAPSAGTSGPQPS